MSTEYNYDEQLENTAPRIQSDFKPHHADLIEGQKKKQKRRERKLKRMITVVTGWLVIGWMIYLIMVTARTIPKIWDPYDILGISRSASEKAIKSHYKRLGLKYHPDKIRPDPAKNQTLESLNNHFVELTKAYKALTDEEVRNNYIQYGHPDGKQSLSIGIALPKFLVTEGNGKYVLLVYGLLLGVLLPYVVGKWWYGTQSRTKEKVLIASAGNLFKEYAEGLSEGGVVGTLSAGEEYKDALKGDKGEAGMAKIESGILSEQSAGTGGQLLTIEDRKRLEQLEGGVRRKALGLLWAYLGRVDLKDATLNDEKFEVAPIALALNEALLAITLAYGNTKPILSCFHTSQNLIQAIPPGASPLLQLPHITTQIAQAIEGPSTKTHMSVQHFMRLSEEKRRRLAIGSGLLSESQYQTAISIAKQIPLLKVEKAFFKVMGEKYITPSSLVQLVIKARIIPPGSTDVPAVNELDLEDVDPDEGDIDALLGRKGGRNKKAVSSSENKDEDDNENNTKNAIQPPLAFGPYFPRDHSPRWHVFLGDGKQGKLAVPPFTFTSFNKPLFHPPPPSSSSSSSNSIETPAPTFAMQTFRMQFQAPPQAGQYTFVMYLLCDSYVGTDTKLEVTLTVDEMVKAVEEEQARGKKYEEDEISEPDEDSLAGQMNALRRGSLSTAAGGEKKKKKRVVVDEEDDDDDTSGTEGDEDQQDTSETDTSTDEED
ncbi:MAG: secretory subunit [Peltula sp. TS41687]|nr:MAG: secretory subunit [Peltula sp. TS41687]